MKNFTIISNEIYAVKNAGFILDPSDEIAIAVPRRDFESDIHYDNRVQKMVDSFYDLDGAYLCVDENNVFYAVEYSYEEKWQPVIWQRVKSK